MIPKTELGPEISAAGLLIGLLTEGSETGTVEFNSAWFDDPISNLEQCDTRLSDLVALVDAVLGPPSAAPPPVFTDAQWYAIPDFTTGQPSVFQIVATAPADSAGQIGLGVLYTIALGDISGTAYAYIPLFSYDENGATLIVDSVTNPCQVGLYITSPDLFVINTDTDSISFSAIDLAGFVYLNPDAYNAQPQYVTLTFESLQGTDKPSVYTSLSSMLDNEIEPWLLQVAIQSGAWLNTYLGNTGFTVGDVLEAAAILSRNYLFEPANILQPAALTTLLTSSTPDPVSAYLWPLFPAADQALLNDANSTPDQQSAALVDGFNTVIQGGSSIYDATRFAGVALSPQTTTLLSQNPTSGDQLVKLNRLLLDDAYIGSVQENPYSINLAALQGSASEIALNLLFAVLNALSLLGFPLLSLPGGGIYITARQRDDGASEDFGLRLLLDLPLTGGACGDSTSDDDQGSSVALDLCLGSWLTGESDGDNWMSRAGGSAPSYAPGVSVFFLNRDTTNNTLSFAPSFSLVSIGVNITSATDKPLVNIGGFTFGGTDLRVFLDPGDPMQPPADWNYGFAIRLDTLGFPLAPGGGTGDGGNPVAQNFLSGGSNSSGGDSGAGSDSEPVNPAFSVAVAWRSDSTNSPKINVELFGSDGAPAGNSAVWIPVQRSFGPITCQRIGIAFDEANDCRLTVLFDGDVAVGPLAVDLIDLSIGIPLSAPLDLDEYTLGLHGMAVAYTSGPLSIMGGMDEDTTATPVEYNGELLIQAAAWAIYAIGSYASLNGHPSLFVFARLSAPIGGPAFFFVTGLCAGFGYNRSLKIPGQDQVADFPLLAGIADPAKIGGDNASPTEALAKLSDWVAPAQGYNWFAAGVQFTSFELIQSNVVLAVVVTGDFEAAVLGLSRAKLPQAGPVQFAYIELGIEIVIHPSAGFFGASAVLTSNSYVLDPACHLTGGFAFYVWFAAPRDGSADHSGDFVITIGGYHPAFTKPAWYPDEARLGFSWQVTPQLTMQGGAYFALTPSCVMGGGALDLQFHAGDLHAWFTAQFNFLFHWKPFYFQGGISVSIGASYKLNMGFCSVTVSVELGASLQVAGPPVAGVVTVSWYIISFSIPFGPSSTAPSASIDWPDFSMMLPQSSGGSSSSSPRFKAGDDSPSANICKLIINGGLSSTVPDSNSQNNLRWLVRFDNFAFTAQTAFPLTAASTETPQQNIVTLYPMPSDPTPQVAVRPMAISSSDTTSSLLLTIQNGSSEYQDLTHWSFGANLGSVPAALWGAPAPGQPSAPSADTIDGSFLGLDLLTPPPPLLYGPPEIPVANLAYDPLDQGDSDFLPLSSQQPGVTPDVTVSQTALAVIAATVADESVVAVRNELFAALVTFGYNPVSNGSTAALGADVNLSYADAPLLGAPWPSLSQQPRPAR